MGPSSIYTSKGASNQPDIRDHLQQNIKEAAVHSLVQEALQMLKYRRVPNSVHNELRGFERTKLKIMGHLGEYSVTTDSEENKTYRFVQEKNRGKERGKKKKKRKQTGIVSSLLISISLHSNVARHTFLKVKNCCHRMSLRCLFICFT